MTKGTARRERKYRRKAVSVCKITSTSSHSNGTSNKPGQTHGLSTIHERLSAATPSASQPNPTTSNNSNTFASPQSLQTTKVRMILVRLVHSEMSICVVVDTGTSAVYDKNP